jgi:hypothetical protein
MRLWKDAANKIWYFVALKEFRVYHSLNLQCMALEQFMYRSEEDEWLKGISILSVEVLEQIKDELEYSPIIVEHWHYRGSRAPSRIIIDDYDDFVEYITNNAVAGDAFHIWNYAKLCKDDNVLVSKKYPDNNGLVPKKGAY